MTSTPPPVLSNGFERALKAFESRLKPSERAQFRAASLDDLKITLLSIQAEQRARKQMMHMGRIRSFLEVMEQFGKVIEVFLNVNNFLAFVWGPIKALLLTAATWSDSFDALLDAYQEISENFPILEGYQSIFSTNEQMQVVLECVWSDILDFHIRALRIFDQSMLKMFFRSLWKDFNSRFQHSLNDLKRQKEIVRDHANQIHIQSYQSDRVKILEEFEHTRAQRSAEKKAFVIQWIGAPRTILDHESLCMVRQEQYDATQRWTGRWTGRWILENEEVKAWLSPLVPKSSIIWVNAVPGAGKTVLASVIITEIEEKDPAPLAFCYCKHNDPDKNTFISILKAFLSQLIIQQDHLLPFYYDEGISSGEVFLHSTKLCKKLLGYMLQNILSAFLIIDGLDECDQNERKLILEFFNELINLCDSTKPGKVRLLIASRDEPDIKKSLPLATIVRIGDQDTFQDIKSYIVHRAGLVERKFQEFGLNKRDREYIEQYVLDKSDGMFLYAKLVMMNLEGQPSLAHLREELYRLPKGLAEAYGRNMDRIQQNPRENEREIARKILSWMVCSRRPLRWRELQAAISIDPIRQIVDSVRRLAIHVRDICGSLVEILPGDRVEFVHATARLHIVDSGYVPLYIAELSMSTLCLNYLTFECFEKHMDADQLNQFGKEGYFAFQDYAIDHWADHLLAWIESLSDTTLNHPNVEKEDSDTVVIFRDRFSADLTAFPTDQELILRCDQLQLLDCFPIMTLLWRHAKSFRALQDDRQDKVSLLSLGKALEGNRSVLEDLSMELAKGSTEADSLRSLYGENWFKCSRLSCYFFHEGFQSKSSRQGHYDRHDRPFRCEEEDCPGGAMGFASLKEMEKHKRNMHPGIDKLSATFARLKKGSAADALLEKYPCPLCPSKFAIRFECRVHMSSHNRPIIPARV